MVAQQLQLVVGHEIKVISGWTVSMWINTHLSGQKTDLNDAIALSRLAVSDAELTPIRHKSIKEIHIQTVQAVRQQLMSQRSKSIVSFKAKEHCQFQSFSSTMGDTLRSRAQKFEKTS